MAEHIFCTSHENGLSCFPIIRITSNNKYLIYLSIKYNYGMDNKSLLGWILYHIVLK